MSEQLTAQVIIQGDGQYILCEGSYIKVVKEGTSTTVDAVRGTLARRGVLNWGEDVNEKTGRVNKDIKLKNKTELAYYLYGTKSLKKGNINSSSYGDGFIEVTFTDGGSEKIPTLHTTELNFNVPDTLADGYTIQPEGKFKTILRGILADLKPGLKLTKIGTAELLFLWGCRTGLSYGDVRELITTFDSGENTISKVRKKVKGTGILYDTGIEKNKGRSNYLKWTMQLTVKGVQHYEELVKNLIVTDRQEHYIGVGKKPFEDDLKGESIYDFYQRIIRLNSLTTDEVISALPQHNVSKVLNMVTYYQVTLDKDINFKDDVNKIIDETDSVDIYYTIKRNLEYSRDHCLALIQKNNNDNESKKNVTVLTSMLEIVGEMMDCNM